MTCDTVTRNEMERLTQKSIAYKVPAAEASGQKRVAFFSIQRLGGKYKRDLWSSRNTDLM